MKVNDNLNDLETLDKVLKLWVNSIDCLGIECSKCYRVECCTKVFELIKIIEEKTNEEL